MLLVARSDQSTIAGLSTDDLGSLVYHVGLVVLVGGGVLVLFREKLSQALEAALFWVVVGLVLAVGYTYRADLRSIADRVMAELVPGRAAQLSGRAVESCAAVPAISRWRRRSTAPASPWRWTPAPAPLS